MAEDEEAETGSSGPGETAPAPNPNPAGTPYAAADATASSGVPPGYPPAGFGAPYSQRPYPGPQSGPAPYGPASYGPPPYGPPPYGPPPYGPPPYGPPPYGSQPYGRPACPASGWVAPQQGAWGAPGPYLQAAWGYPPGYGPASYPPPGPGPGIQWAGIGVRFGALVLDGVILIVGLFAVALLVSAIGGYGSSAPSDAPATTAVGLIWWLVALSYNPVCWYVFGSTLGQKAFGLRVAQASNGQSLGMGAVLVRYLIFFMVTVFFPLGLVSAAMASNDPFKRAWHDDVARSVVVRQ
jgi:uncharacterized RDD family membrane protein YckC